MSTEPMSSSAKACDKRIAFILDVELETVRHEQCGASPRPGASVGEPQG
jgi:hypothetical protein